MDCCDIACSGRQWKWYAIGWAAAGLGIITKGVGFLPLLVLLPYAFSGAADGSRVRWCVAGWRWLIGPLALIAAVSIWLVPMLMAAAMNPALQAYRDEISVRPDVDRYAAAWHHAKPFWYFIIDVIPGLVAAADRAVAVAGPRLVRRLARAGSARCLPLAWVVLVVLFFSLSSGKRGVYSSRLPGAGARRCAMARSVARRRVRSELVFVVACAVAAMWRALCICLSLTIASR